MFRVFAMPRSDPSQTTLLADRQTWIEVAEHLKKQNKSGWALLVQQALNNNGEGALKLTFQNETAQAIQRALGLSA
jgi:hypothetical protein